jgi:serine/threonine-protein kinase HipA
LLDADWTMPSIDYDGLLNAVRGATRDERAVLAMFRRMAFNVLALNRDDHAKQHALLLNRSGRWRLSPAYDLTFAAGPGNEHYLTVNGRGRDITRRDVLAVADAQSIAARVASSTIEQVATAVAELPAIASDYGVTQSTRAAVKDAIEASLRLML